jgi:hypothetical protein
MISVLAHKVKAKSLMTPRVWTLKVAINQRLNTPLRLEIDAASRRNLLLPGSAVKGQRSGMPAN